MKSDLQKSNRAIWELGPYHGALPGPMKVRARLDGEVVAALEVETGFVHKGLEKSFEFRSWKSAITYVDRLDPEAAVFGELALCLAVEKISGLKPSPRAQAVRLLVSELSRISAHMHSMAKMAASVGADTVIHYILRDREKILDLFELLTGARFALNFLRFGGLASDVSEGFLERVIEVGELIRTRLKEYNDVFSFNYVFLKRSTGVGILTPAQAIRHGVTGPNARASGVSFDVRRNHPYSGYERLEINAIVGSGEFGVAGDAHDRFLVRLREISQSLDMIRQIAEALPDGEYQGIGALEDFAPPSGEAYVRVESSRGLLGCHLVSDGSSHPCRIQFRVPSVCALSAAQDLLVGTRIEDLPVILASFDLSLAEVDR